VTLRFQRPSLPAPEAIEHYLDLARRERWFSNFGPCCLLLRDRLREATGCETVPVVNATLGLMVAIAALRRRSPAKSTQALVPSFAFAASAQALVWNGLEPVFVDVDRRHWQLDPDALEQALWGRRGEIAIVVALSSFGTPPPSDVRKRWEAICDEAGVPLLVDSAAGFGAHADDGLPVGAQGDAEVVSFHAVKPLAIGEGGAVFTRDEELAEEILRLVQFGFDENRAATSRHGLNAKLPEPSAAIALAALDEFPEHLQARRGAAARILERLPQDLEPQLGHAHSTWQFVPVAAASAEVRSAVLDASRGVVELRTYYEPLHLMPAFASTPRASELAATTDLAERMLSLPMAEDLTDSELDEIIQAVARTAVV
jgi:dTDP-4-amino-4,6-dideoxygalactose transaminase